MKIVSTGYINTPEFNDPQKWLDRISFYTGILEELSKNHEVESIEQINFSGEILRNRVRYHFINLESKKRYFTFSLNKYIRKLNPDVVFVNGFISPLQIIHLKNLLAKHCRVFIFHRAEKPFTGFMKLIQVLADRFVDGYLFSSLEFGAEWINAGIIKNKNKIHEVIQGSSIFQQLDKKLVRSIISVKGSPVFLWVGRLNSNKDPLTVIKAFKKYLEINAAAELYMIYQTEELINEVKDLIENTDSIHLLGKVEHKNLEYWYNSAEFIISGSHYEGSGIAICEAMSCGCIPIVTNITSFKSMTGRGNCGYLYDPGNADDLLSILKKLKYINFPGEREKTISQFKKELSFQAIKEKINTILEK